ncbi:hypothetical protein LY78DRAFT_637191 [Colletotrichum sublineola]|nr:hypothetical protein LY78DRAFT_637191 [Colletotrichum sublineola]
MTQSWKNFCTPRLRQFDPQANIVWKEQLGFGVDGIVWKADSNGRTYAVKVFWDNTHPEGNRYWAIQRECHNAALLQMLQASIDSADTPIYLNPKPTTQKHALINLQAFSNEGRSKAKLKQLPNAVSCTSMPPMRECFGWTKVSGQELWSLRIGNIPPRAAPLKGIRRDIQPFEEYYAIVYDFVAESQCPLDNSVVQSQLDFYYLAGFCLTVTMRKDNWKGRGILIDMADLICPWHMGWYQPLFYRRLADEFLAEA